MFPTVICSSTYESFKQFSSHSSANKCLLKVAHYSAQQENYDKAFMIYEEIADSSLESPLLKYSAKDYFFRVSCFKVFREGRFHLSLLALLYSCSWGWGGGAEAERVGEAESQCKTK